MLARLLDRYLTKYGKGDAERRFTFLYCNLLTILFAVLLVVYLAAYFIYTYFSGRSFVIVLYNPITYALLALLIWFLIDTSKYNFYKNQASITDSKIDVNVYGEIIGAPVGAGKTSYMVYTKTVQAQKLWQFVKTTYFISSGKVEQWRRENNVDMLIRWKELKETYDYFNKHIDTHIPCLLSNIKIKVGDRVSYDLSIDHFLQRRRAPAFSAVVYDDSGNDTPAKNTISTPPDMIAFAKFYRHFAELRVGSNDQRDTNQVQCLRASAQKNITIIGFKCVCQAKFLRWLRCRAEMKMARKGYVTADSYKKYKFSRYMYVLKYLEDCIGFRRYELVENGNVENIYKNKSDTVCYAVLPRSLGDCEYDSRSHSNGYLAKNLPLEDPKPTYGLKVTAEDYFNNQKLVNDRFGIEQNDDLTVEQRLAFLANFETLKTSRNLSYKVLAKETGIEHRNLYAISENGEIPSVSDLLKLSDYFNVSISRLFRK